MSEDNIGVVSIAGLDKAELLAALYNAASPIGLGFLNYKSEPMTKEEASTLISRHEQYGLYFDYVHGRPLKVNLAGDELKTGLYDRDQGYGRCKRVVDNLRAGLATDENLELTESRVNDARELAQHNTRVFTSYEEPVIEVFELGLGDMSDVLIPALDKAESEIDKKKE